MLVQPAASASSSVSGLSQSHSQQDNENGTSMGSSLDSVIIGQTPLRSGNREGTTEGSRRPLLLPAKSGSVAVRILTTATVAVRGFRLLVDPCVDLVRQFGEQQ